MSAKREPPDDGLFDGFTPVHLAGKHYFMVPTERAEAAEAAMLKARSEGRSAKEQLRALKAAAWPKEKP